MSDAGDPGGRETGRAPVLPAREPSRLRSPRSHASAEARALLEVMRSEQPGADRIARLAERLPLGPPGRGGQSASKGSTIGLAPPTAEAASLVWSAAIGASLALLVLGGAWLRDAWSTRAAAPSTAPTVVASTGAPAAPSNAVAAPPATAPQARAPQEPSSHELHASAAPAAPAPGPARSAAAALPADTSAPVAQGPTAGADAPVVAGGGAETEVELLQRARQVLSQDPAQAFAAAEEHRRRFRSGMLAQEREVIAISALVGLRRIGEARERSARFVESYPRSAHRPTVEALVAGRSDQKSERGGRPTQ